MNYSNVSVQTVQRVFAVLAILAMVFMPFANVQLAQATHEDDISGYLDAKNDGLGSFENPFTQKDKVPICHQTGSGYSAPNPSIQSFFSGGHDSDLNDIIPPFHYLDDEENVVSFLGTQWTSEFIEIWENNCSDPSIILGCTDPQANNYNIDATVSDNSCTYDPAPVLGCTDPLANNYNETATANDGSCTYPDPGNDDVLGCTDSEANNYNETATANDGSCTYDPAPVLGCTDPLANNYDETATANDGSCTYDPAPVLGCTDPSANNYNDAATQEDGSCSYPEPLSCELVSDSTTQEGGSDSFEFTKNPAWVTITDAEWIWGDADNNAAPLASQTFTKAFELTGTPTVANLDIAADNGYLLKVNGVTVDDRLIDSNFTSITSIDILSYLDLNPGAVNTLEITVSNHDNGFNNPAGLAYKLTLDDASCKVVDLDLGSITIEKAFQADAPADWSFDFTTSLGNFTLTDEDDSKTFTNLTAGEYLVIETIPEGWDAPVISCDADNAGEGQGDGHIAMLLGEGADITCTVTNQTEQVQTFLVEGYVWNDKNQDDEQNSKEDLGEHEEFQGGWTINIVDANNNDRFYSTTSDEFGYYYFNVPAGTWTITEVMQEEWGLTYPNDGSHEVTVPELQNAMIESENFFASVMNMLVPVAYAQVPPRNSRFDFGNVFIGNNGGGNNNNGGGNGRNISLRDGNGSVRGDSTSDDPQPLVLGEATSTMPVGAPNTGAGGAATTSPVLHSVVAILSERKGVQATNEK